ncbi:response regulator [Candidatus Margulisiibacteriota bacterium]
MKKIVVIDDEDSICNMLKKFLEKKGYRTFTATSVAAGIKIIKEERPHITLLDIRMPEKNGVEALKEIKEIDSEIGVIMITAVKEEGTAKKCMELGAYDYITKPFELEYLDEALLMKILDFETK